MDPILISLLKPISWFIFGSMTLLSILAGLVLAYHWKRYAMNPAGAFTSLIIYSVGVFILLSTLFVATIAINL